MHTSKDTDAESGVRRKASPEASEPAVPHEAWHVVQQREGWVRSALVQDESARAGS